MMKEIRKSVRASLSLGLVAALLCICCVSIFAAGSADVDPDRTGSVTVTLDGEKNGTLSLYKVADLKLEDWNMTYTYTDAFKDCGVDIENYASQADAFSAWVQNRKLQADDTASIDRSGKATFSDLKAGLYLIVQTGSSAGYLDINPFLVSIPMDVGGTWVYDVDADSKVEPGTTTQPGPSREPEPSEEPIPSEEPSEGPGPSETPEVSQTPTPEVTPVPSEEVTPTPTVSESPAPGESTSPSPSGSAIPTPSAGGGGGNTDTSTPTPGTGAGEVLPQTGLLIWPIPILFGIGLVLFILGLVVGTIYSRGEKKKEK